MVKAICGVRGAYTIINVDREVLGHTGDGHFMPLIAYNK